MRLTKLQKIQKVAQQNQHQQFKRNWRTTLILLGGSAGLGAGLWTLSVAAATTTTSVATSPTTVSSVTTNSTTSAAAVTLSTGSTTSVATTVTTSAAAPTATTSSETATPASAVTTTTTTATTGSAGAGLSLPSLAVSAPSSAFGSTASGAVSAASGATSTTGQTTSQGTASAGSQAVTSAASQAASLAALPDTTVVTFADPGLEANVLSDLKLTGSVTLGSIRHFTGSSFNIGTTNVPLMVTSFNGMQYLQSLPAATTISLFTKTQNPSIDLSPLEYDRFNQITVETHDMALMNLKPLTLIDPTTISMVQLCGSINSDLTDYQNNPQGMTNAQLAQIGQWLTSIGNTSTASGGADINLSDNSLTDFSPLGGITKPTMVVAIGERVNYATTPVNLVIGQPATFTALPLTGMTGESLTGHYQATLSGSPTLAATDTTHPQEPALTSLGNGQYQIATAYPTYPNVNWFAYGLRGYYDFTTAQEFYTNFVDLNYPNGVTFEYDVMVYQPANWLTNPELNVKYDDETTGTALQPAELIKGTTIGSAYDLTPETAIAGYRFDPERSSSPTGKYTQDPQALTFSFERQVAGGLTINYVDATGQTIAPSTTIGGYVGATYQSTPLTIPGYTYQMLAVTSLPASGTLPLAAGTVDYQYTANELTRTVQYRDVTSDQVLASEPVTGTYKSVASYDPATTIAAYEAKGYQLMTNNYPANGALFEDPTPTATYEVELAHKTAVLTPATPSLPADVTLERQIKRTVNYVSPTGTLVAAPMQQTLNFTRSALRDLVTGDTTYGPWTPTASTGFDSVTPPTIHNMVPAVSVVPAEDAVTEATPDKVVTVVYTPVGPSDVINDEPTSGAGSSASSNASSSSTTNSEASSSSSETTGSSASSGSSESAGPSSNAGSATSSAPESTAQSEAAPAIEIDQSGTPIQPNATNRPTVSVATPVAKPATSAPTRSKKPTAAPTVNSHSVTHPKAVPAKSAAIPVSWLRGLKPSQPAASASQLPQANEQKPATTVFGLILIALGSLMVGFKCLFKRER